MTILFTIAAVIISIMLVLWALAIIIPIAILSIDALIKYIIKEFKK